MKRFVILATQRSGTKFLSSVLNANKQIHVYDELFYDGMYDDPMSFYHFWAEMIARDGKNITRPRLEQIVGVFLEKIFGYHNDNVAIGINIKYDQLSAVHSLIHRLCTEKVPVIHLVRENVLKTLLSEQLNCMKHQLGRRSHSTECYSPVTVSLRADTTLLQELERREGEIDSIRAIFSRRLPWCELRYEDFCPNDLEGSGRIAPRVLETVYEFLDIPEENRDVNLQTDIKKTNPSDLRNIIRNYDDIAGFLGTTKYKRMLYI